MLTSIGPSRLMTQIPSPPVPGRGQESSTSGKVSCHSPPHGSNCLKRRNAIALLCALIMLGLALVFLWSDDLHDELILLLQPPYRVTQVDAKGGTMTVEGVNEAFVVRCHDQCGSFTVGRKYAMLYHGSTLEFRSKGTKLAFEITEIHVKPPAVPGGMG